MTRKTCPHCLLITTMYGDIKRHIEICKVNQPYVINKLQCRLCMKKFKAQGNLYGHFRKKHPEVGQNVGLTQCPICSNYVPELSPHVKVCQKAFKFANLKKLRCEICQKTFHQQRILYRHIDLHLQSKEGPKIFITRHKKFFTKTGQEYTKIDDCTYQCSKCDISVTNQDAMINHLEFKKSIATNIIFGPNKIFTRIGDVYHCFHCDLSCQCKGSFIDHLKIKHNKILKDGEETASDQKENLGSIDCKANKEPSQVDNVNPERASKLPKAKNLPSKSGKSHNRPIVLIRQKSGKKSGKKRGCHICSYCSKPYEIKIFERHEELCKVLHPFIVKSNECGLCFKKLKNRKLLTLHFLNVHPELIKNAGNLHQCSLCLIHISIDSKDEHIKSCKKLINFANMKTFSCKLCEKKCLNPIDLYAHIKEYHLGYVENPVIILAYSKREDQEDHDSVQDERKMYSKINDHYQCLLCSDSVIILKETLIEHLKLSHKKVLRDDIEQENAGPKDESIIGHKNVESGELSISMISPDVKKEIIKESEFESQIKIINESLIEVNEEILSLEIIEEPEEKTQMDMMVEILTKSNETKNGEKLHQCSICLNHFSIDSKDEHMKSCKKLINFANMKTFSCKVCQKKCTNSIHLYTHIKRYHWGYVENPVFSLAYSKRGDQEERNFVPNERKLYSKIGDHYLCLMCSNSVILLKETLIEHLKLRHKKVLSDDIEEENAGPKDESIIEHRNVEPAQLSMETESMNSPEVKKEIIEDCEVENQMKMIGESLIEVKEEIKQEFEGETQMDISDKIETKPNETVMGIFKCQLCTEVYASMQDIKMHIQSLHKIFITQ